MIFAIQLLLEQQGLADTLFTFFFWSNQEAKLPSYLARPEHTQPGNDICKGSSKEDFNNNV